MEFTGSENDNSPSNSEESDSTFHDCISSGSESADDSLNTLADVRQLTKVTAKQSACRSYLSKQASDAIKQIDELSDRMSGIVVVQKPLMLASNKPTKTDNRYPYEKSSMDKQQQYYARDSDQVNRRKYKNPSRSQNQRAFDSRDKVDEFFVNHRKEGLSKKVRKLQPALPHKARRRFQRQHEFDASLSSTSSKWKSRKTSIPQQWTPRSSSGSANYSPSSGDGSQESSVGSNDDNEVYSWVSGDGPSGRYYSGDDESEGYSKPRRQHLRQVRRSTSTKKMRQRRVDASSLWENACNKKGGCKKLKDKLSAILPHHHHHHRHNQKYTDGYGDDLNSSKLHRKAHRKKVPSKHTAIRSPFLKVGAILRQAVEKIENARDSKVVQKPMNVIQGLFNHACRAKKSKLPLRGSQYGKTKKHSKMNWFKMLQICKKKPKKLGIGFRKSN